MFDHEEDSVRDRSLNPMKSKVPCILAYHEILPEPARYVYRVSTARFREHLDFLATQRRTTDPSASGHYPQITFDDGHVSNAVHALPMLDKAGCKATFFVLAGRVGQIVDAMSWEQARSVVASGHDVQSHGWSHRLLTQCSPKDLARELVYSKK